MQCNWRKPTCSNEGAVQIKKIKEIWAKNQNRHLPKDIQMANKKRKIYLISVTIRKFKSKLQRDITPHPSGKPLYKKNKNGK